MSGGSQRARETAEGAMQELQRGLRVLPARCYCQRWRLTKFRLLVVAAGAHCAQDVHPISNLSAAVLTCLGASKPCPARCPLPAATHMPLCLLCLLCLLGP
jgi:hypothetical protein